MSSALETATIGIEGMHCASCVARIEKQISSIPGVSEALVNLTSEQATVSYDPRVASVSQLEAAVSRAVPPACSFDTGRGSAGAPRARPSA